ncbi:hypothetical protein DPSP01_009874 [Paraphaeosphaeria sporulosa]|uniref:DUF2231 domain-containing protein n=1 Tax=Paraphaeosphaeria sporulosa TaxID=1460663 RepID=A0A177BTA5_9PLEO|nr:uncharacterized protein CC84DRAFT_1210713 [Paraphaeosphaeria sporulosa]OAF98623.1 hypothetical protein CC84DRAFT_1210713 [Paraphaeosphaeria sporulosa]
MSGKHPKHPATVHFPLTFTFLTGVLDAIYLASVTPATSGTVATVFKTLDIAIPTSLLPTLSYYSTILTLLTAIPAVISGALELQPVIARDGFSSKKAQAGVSHALVNDIALFGAAYNWWVRRSTTGFVPDTTNVAISAALALPASFFAAYLGGQLVYQYGMGVGRGSSAARKAQ